jgi:glycosyltransferase involved in cell wall biosynthesis
VRIAYASPLPPLSSGIADYSAELAPALAAAGCELELFFEDRAAPPPPLGARFRCRSVRELGAAAADFDLVLYHLGNSAPHHAGIYDTLLEVPGVVVLHEFMLHHLVRERTLVAGDARAYVEEMRYAAGETGRRAAQRLLDSHYPVDVWSFPLFERVVDRSRAVLVHSEFARRRVRASRPGARVETVPFPVALAGLEPVTPAARAAARAELGLPADALVVGSFGFVTPQKRLEPVLRAFAALRRRRPQALLLVAGEISPHYDFDAALAAAGGEGVRVTGRLPLERFHRAMAAADFALNLRHPTGGETSASLLRLLALGVPTVVTRAGSFADLPAGAVASVPVDELEEPLLEGLFETLAGDAGLRRAMGEAARRHVERVHALPGAAAVWMHRLRELADSPRAAPAAAPPLAPWDGVDPRLALAASLGADLVDLGVGGDAEALGALAGTLAELGWAPDGTPPGVRR